MFNSISDLSRSLKVSSSGMNVHNKRLLVVAQNIANAGTKATEPGGPAYQRKLIRFVNRYDRHIGTDLVQIQSITRDHTPFKMVYAPEDPGANAEGFVAESNVKPMIELADMREASLSHEANLKAYEKALSIWQETINLLKS